MEIMGIIRLSINLAIQSKIITRISPRSIFFYKCLTARQKFITNKSQLQIVLKNSPPYIFSQISRRLLIIFIKEYIIYQLQTLTLNFLLDLVRSQKTRQAYTGPPQSNLSQQLGDIFSSKMIFEQNKTNIRWTPGSQIYLSSKKNNFWSKMIFEQKNKKGKNHA